MTACPTIRRGRRAWRRLGSAGLATIPAAYNRREMPVHDWPRIYAGVFDHLHVTWLVELARALNRGLLPAGYYALGEQVIGGAVPDVLTLGLHPARDTPAPTPASPAVRSARL